MKKAARIIAAALFLPVMTVSVFAETIQNAFSPMPGKLTDSYSEYYGWEEEKILTEGWSEEYNGEIRNYHRYDGFQAESVLDMTDYTWDFLKKYAEEYEIDYEISNFGTSSAAFAQAGGKRIAAAAMAEVGTPRSVAVGSNEVFYNDWYYYGSSGSNHISGDIYPWCAVFVSWCADQCGYIGNGKVFPRKFNSCTNFWRTIVLPSGWYTCKLEDTYPFGGSYQPVPGDLIEFWESGEHDSNLAFSHIGIVVGSDAESVYVVEGNCCSRVCYVSYSPDGTVNHTLNAEGSIYARDRNARIIHVLYQDDYSSAYNFLVCNAGYRENAALAVLGAMKYHSGFNYSLGLTDINADTFGLLAWHKEKRGVFENWIKKKGKSYSEYAMLEFFLEDMEKNHGGLHQTMQAEEKNLQEFVELFEREYYGIADSTICAEVRKAANKVRTAMES